MLSLWVFHGLVSDGMGGIPDDATSSESRPSIRNYDALKNSLRTNYDAKRFFIAPFTSIDSFDDDCRGSNGQKSIFAYYIMSRTEKKLVSELL